MRRKKATQWSGFPLPPLATALVSVLLVVACSSTSSTLPSPTSQPTPQAPPATSAAPPASNSQYMTVDSSSKPVNLMLNITGFSFDGYSNAQMTANVPQAGVLSCAGCQPPSSIRNSTLETPRAPA